LASISIVQTRGAERMASLTNKTATKVDRGALNRGVNIHL